VSSKFGGTVGKRDRGNVRATKKAYIQVEKGEGVRCIKGRKRRKTGGKNSRKGGKTKVVKHRNKKVLGSAKRGLGKKGAIKGGGAKRNGRVLIWGGPLRPKEKRGKMPTLNPNSRLP